MGLDEERPAGAVGLHHGGEHLVLGLAVQKPFGYKVPGQEQHRTLGGFGQRPGEEHLPNQRLLFVGEPVEPVGLGILPQLLGEQGRSGGALGLHRRDSLVVAPVQITVAQLLPQLEVRQRPLLVDQRMVRVAGAGHGVLAEHVGGFQVL